MMQKRRLGRTDMEVSWLGFGGARIGHEKSTQEETARLLHALLDAGVNFVDTAECYTGSEEMIGNALAARRSEYYLATKCGHVVDGATGEEFSAKVITENIDRSLRRLKTDRVDLVQFHSCSAEVLRRGDAVDALLKARAAGKTRYIGYSGDGEDAEFAIGMGIFDTLQTSFNLVDQSAAAEVLPAALAAGLGIIAKRPIANAAFGRASSPSDYADEYWRRSRQFRPPAGAPPDSVELALRFVRSFDEIDVAIVGTSKAEHALSNIRISQQGPLDPAAVSDLRRQFRELGAAWQPMN